MDRVARLVLPAVVAAATTLVALPASAQFAKPEDAIKYRRSVMTVMSTHFGRVAAMANGRIPYDAKAAAENADIAVKMSQLPFVAFIPGTDKGETRAEAKIWSEPDKFKSNAEQMQAAMQKVDAAAKGNNLDALKAAVGDAGKTCKACHDAYRKE